MKLQLQNMRHFPGRGIVVEEEEDQPKHGKYRLTDHGFTDDSTGWWYLMRKYPDKDNPYWYRKRRPEPDKEPEEEYVGLELPFDLPQEWLNKIRKDAMKS